ncbi:MAG: hypothetical protein H7A48_14660, partial [Akkermansiaceae bacterium]|nr:hypothetical protein [Akkermansiaceae bacterium]
MEANPFHAEAGDRGPAGRGFALVVTLSLLILLTTVAVGLLSLASISLRTSSQGEAMSIARANARLALAMALGDLQREMGADTRISIRADQRTEPGGDGGESSAKPANRQWTGVYDAWPAASEARPEPGFRRWLVSGRPQDTEDAALPDKATSSGVRLVGAGTLGTGKADEVMVPAVEIKRPDGEVARLGWWVADQGMKASISTPAPNEENSLGAVRQGVQAAPRNALSFANGNGGRPFDDKTVENPSLQLVTSWPQAGFVASAPDAHRSLFHDLTAFSSGLLTNVRRGGFRKDLSMQLERPISSCPDLPLYQVDRQNGINLRELCAYYNLYEDLRWSGSATYTTGGRIPSRTPYLQLESSPAACQNDEEFDFKMPLIVNYQMVFSFSARKVSSGGKLVNRLHLVADPIITFWNPLDVPVVIPRSAFVSVKFWQIPYDFFITRGGGSPIRCPLLATLSNRNTGSDYDANYMSLRIGELEQLVFKPGEVIKASQSGNMIVKSGNSTDHNLAGRSGFNYGGGVSLPIMDMNGRPIDLADNETITYEARPNNLTCGKTASSGNTFTGETAHTRHFSLTHHETYIGADRGNSGQSLGYGGIYIDFDFGNKRLGANDAPRDTRQPGTKPPGERLYANRFPEIFEPVTKADGRPLSSAQLLADKAPFMVFSFGAKTETETDTGTRFLTRFNPKAHHVDFYDLSGPERDALPYEVRIEPLVS